MQVATFVGFGQTDACLAHFQRGRVADVVAMIDAAMALTTIAGALTPQFQLQEFRNRASGVARSSPAADVWNANDASALCALFRQAATQAALVPGFSAATAKAIQALTAATTKAPTPPFVEVALLETEEPIGPRPLPALEPIATGATRFPAAGVLVSVGILSVAALGIYIFMRSR